MDYQDPMDQNPLDPQHPIDQGPLDPQDPMDYGESPDNWDDFDSWPLDNDPEPVDRRPQEFQPPRRVRKNNKAKHLTQAYLPALMVVVAVIGIILIIAGAIRGSSKKDDLPSVPPTETLTAEQEAQAEEGRALMRRAADLAGQYDYDGAISLLNTFAGDKSLVDGMAEAVSDYEAAKASLIPWTDYNDIPHLSFQSLVADSARAFDGDSRESQYKSYNFTIAQFREILQQLYDNGYVLVSLYDVGTMGTDSEGNASYVGGSINLPAGKKPLVLSQVPVNYYLSMVDGDGDGTPDASGNGFAYRLSLDGSGSVTADMVGSDGQTRSGSYDIVPVLDDFIATHPGFSYHGAKATLGVTGYEGVLGYRTDAEQAEAQMVVQALLDSGYNFACFSYSDMEYGSSGIDDIKLDLANWSTYVEPIIGKTDILFYVTGSDIAGTGTSYSGEKYDALYEAGFRYFVGMGSSSWTEFTSEYVRETRTTVNPNKLQNSGSIFQDLFNPVEILALS